MAMDNYGKPRITFKSPFRRGSRGPTDSPESSKVDTSETSKGQDGPMGKVETDDELNNEAQGKEEGAGENEYDMQVNDIMGHLKDQHPEVSKRLHKVLTKHLSGDTDESSNDYSDRSSGGE